MTNDSGDRYTLVTAERLIDGTGAPPIERGAVLVKGDAIVAAGPRESVVPPEGAPVDILDYPHGTVLPGLIDSHVHLIGIGDGRTGDELVTLPDEILTVQAAENARRHLYSGVTTVRDCGAKNRTTFLLRQAMDMGIATGPRLLLSGRPMAIVGGHLSYFGIEATGVDECRAAVRQLIKEGADFIKITATGGSTATSHPFRPSFNVDELTAIIEEAHKFGKHAAAHCASSQGMVNTLDAGIDTIIHAYFKEPDGTFMYRPEIADRIAEQGVFVNPTMHQARNRLWRLEEKAETEGLTPQERADLQEGMRIQEIRYRPGGADGRRRSPPHCRVGRGVVVPADGLLPARDTGPHGGRTLAAGGHRLGDWRRRQVLLGGRRPRRAAAGQAGRPARGTRRPLTEHRRAVGCGGRVQGRGES